MLGQSNGNCAVVVACQCGAATSDADSSSRTIRFFSYSSICTQRHSMIMTGRMLHFQSFNAPPIALTTCSNDHQQTPLLHNSTCYTLACDCWTRSSSLLNPHNLGLAPRAAALASVFIVTLPSPFSSPKKMTSTVKSSLACQPTSQGESIAHTCTCVRAGWEASAAHKAGPNPSRLKRSGQDASPHSCLPPQTGPAFRQCPTAAFSAVGAVR
jgi:hypothetical protein